MSAGVFLDRMRANAALALSEGATLAQIQAHLLTVTRGLSRPGIDEHTDGVELAELAETLTGFRKHQVGEVPARGQDQGEDSVSVAEAVEAESARRDTELDPEGQRKRYGSPGGEGA